MNLKEENIGNICRFTNKVPFKKSKQEGRDYLSSQWYRKSVYCCGWGIFIS